MILLVFTSRSLLFQFSPKRTSSLKCANSGANSPSAFLPAVCTIFAIFFSSKYNSVSMSYARVLSTHFSISCLFALFSSPPSTNSAPGADGWSSLIVLPNPLPPDVANSVIFLPVNSYYSRNVLMIVGATYHQIGNPSTISS